MNSGVLSSIFDVLIDIYFEKRWGLQDSSVDKRHFPGTPWQKEITDCHKVSSTFFCMTHAHAKQIKYNKKLTKKKEVNVLAGVSQHHSDPGWSAGHPLSHCDLRQVISSL